MTAPKPFAITLEVGSSLANRTGNWRTERPVYVQRLAPCNAACPAGEDTQAWLYRAEEGDYEAAWRKLVETNPFPAVMGRVCYHPCETSCNRARLDEAVGIHAVERFLGDHGLEMGWPLPAPPAVTGKRVLVVGAGPCGLSGAYHLRRQGHSVTVADASGRPGGMMAFGIPQYRLPRPVLDGEIERIAALGVEMLLDTPIANVGEARKAGGYDAVLVAVGAQLSHHTDIPAGDSARILDALRVLHDAADPIDLHLGRTVAVYGGGDTAIDAARTALRLGATDPVIIYRRDREHMPAHPEELEEAHAEGIRMRWLSTIRRAEPGRLVLEKMSLDGYGFPQPTGVYEELAADSLVLALGQDTDLSLVGKLPGVSVTDGVLNVGPDLMTGAPGVFAGGDASPGDRSVTRAVGDGASAARRIHEWLTGTGQSGSGNRAPAPFETLNLWYYADAPRTVQPELDAIRRRDIFDEVVGGLTEDNAVYEARRCLSCGNCLECDNCYAVCPDNAVIKLGPGEKYAIDYDYCKGCGICVTECPCGAIEMQPEPD